MTEKELIGKIRRLSQIKPSKDWASLTKNQILGEEPKISFFPYFELLARIKVLAKPGSYFKPAFAGLMTIFVLFGVFSFAQNSLPGDILYSLKKIVEKGQAVFVSSDEKPVFQLKLANERLEDLVKAPVKNLAPTISEFQANISEAAKNISDESDLTRILEETMLLQVKIQKIEALGIVTGGTEALSYALNREVIRREVNNLIENMENIILTEEKQGLLKEMKELVKDKKYQEAFELYLININQ